MWDGHTSFCDNKLCIIGVTKRASTSLLKLNTGMAQAEVRTVPKWCFELVAQTFFSATAPSSLAIVIGRKDHNAKTK